MRSYFLNTIRLGFSHWTAEDLALAMSLWGDAQVTRYIAKPGGFTADQVAARLALEMDNQRDWGISYWPIFEKDSGAFVGCCGLRPFPQAGTAEMGFHLIRSQWGKGYATEAARAVIQRAFGPLGMERIVAGHHPGNDASRALLGKLGFRFIGDNYYAPTGLYHPSYELLSP